MTDKANRRAFGFDPVAHMNAARDAHRRRGTTGGKARGVVIAKRSHHADLEGLDRRIAEIRARMRSGFADIREGFRFDMNRDQWEGF